MHLLLIHQNFPAQFRQLAPAWLATGHQVTAIGCRPEPPEGDQWRGLRYWSYQVGDANAPTEPSCEERGQAVAQLCGHLLAQGSAPDLVMAHSAWGEALQLRNLLPGTPLVIYPELWGSPAALGVGLDPQLDHALNAADQRGMLQRIERQNLLAELAISQADAVVIPSLSQRASFPEALQRGMHLIPEGVDLEDLHPLEGSHPIRIGNQPLPADAALVTLVSRNLEPLRGLRQALQAWPLVAKAEPKAHLVLVGDPEAGYGEEKPALASHLEDALAALPADTDRSRILHFGRLAYPELVTLLQASHCHLGLSYPYTLSWSLLEAMACGAPVITNHGSPLAAELSDNATAQLVPFDDVEALAQAILRLLQSPEERQRIGQAGRRLISQHFNLAETLERYDALFQSLLHS